MAAFTRNMNTGSPTLARFLCALLACALHLNAASAPSTPTAARFSAAELTQGHSASTVIAQPLDEAESSFDDDVEQSLGLALRKRLDALGGTRVLSLPEGATLGTVLETLRNSGRYAWVTVDRILETKATIPNDPNFSAYQWSLRNTGAGGRKAGADISATTAWDTRTSASGVIVAVIDSGLYLEHPDIAANLWTNSSEVAGDGRDNDGNGYIDDVHGINAIDGVSSALKGTPSDDEGHGTHVAGIIGAVGNNGTGIAGVAWQVRIMPLKFLDSQGKGTSSDAIECYNYAIARGASVINASYGIQAGAGYDVSELWAIQRAQAKGIIVVCAAGNDAADTDSAPTYPACHAADNVLSVGNSTDLDDVATSSNRGSGSCDLFAPGSEILSLAPLSTGYLYAEMSGTSMAAPHVTGAVALLRAQFPTDTYRQTINRLLRGVDKLGAYAGKCQTGGRLNLAKALTTTDSAPFNDAFSNAAQLSGPVVSIRSSNTNATRESGEPSVAGSVVQSSLWFAWTAPSGGAVTIDTAGSGFDTLLAVYTGTSIGSLSLVAENDNGTTWTSSSRVSFQASAGVTYRISIASKTTATGLVMAKIGTVAAHDTFTTPRELSGLSPLQQDTNATATSEPNEPVIAGISGGKSLWYRWTAPQTARYEFSVTTASFAPLLAVYTGDSLQALQAISTFADSTGSPTCAFSATQGTSYLLCVNSQVAGTGGPFALAVTDVSWNGYMGGPVTNALAVGPCGVVYAGDGSGNFKAFNHDGSLRWSTSLGLGMDSSGIAVAPTGTVVFPDIQGNVTAATAEGVILWKTTLAGTIHNAPAIGADGRVFIKDDNGTVYALDATTGATLWTRALADSGSYAGPVIRADSSLIVCDSNGIVHALSAATGAEMWSFSTNGAIYATPALFADGSLCVTTMAGGVYRISSTGSQTWMTSIGAAITSSPAITGEGLVVFAAYDGKLHALSGTTGAEQWSFNLGAEARSSSPVVGADGSVYVGSYDYRLWAIKADGSGGRPYSTGNIIRSSPVIDGNRLYFGSNDGRVYAVDLPGSGAAESPWPLRGGDALRSGRVRVDTPTLTFPIEIFPILSGRTYTLTATATGSGLGYQWFKDGVALAGATSPTLSLANAGANDAGTYALVVTSAKGSTVSAPLVLTVQTPKPGRIINLSARGVIPAPGQTFTLGFSVKHGSTPKPLLIRGLGPTLQPLIASQALGNPALTVFNIVNDIPSTVGGNLDWVTSPDMLQAQANFTGLPLLTASTDAATILSLSQLNTCEISEQANGTGVTLGELYDIDPAEGDTPQSGRLVNVSARNHVGVDFEILVAGIVIDGNLPKTLLIRGIGPTLARWQVPGYLQDPELRLFKGSTLYATNDNWGGGSELSQAFTTTGAFSLDEGSLDAALLVTLSPGSYTVELRGVNRSTGNGMIEVYEVP